MSGTRRPLQGKKILVASVGVATLVFAGCAAFPGCNLMGPPCTDPAGADCIGPVDLAKPADGSTDAR